MLQTALEDLEPRSRPDPFGTISNRYHFRIIAPRSDGGEEVLWDTSGSVRLEEYALETAITGGREIARS